MPQLAASISAITLGVSDPTGATAWHRVVGIDELTLAMLETTGLGARAPEELEIPDTGCLHVCLRTADIGVAHAELDAAGARFAAAPVQSQAGPLIAYFHDPGGIQFQLIEVSPGPLAVGDPPPIDRYVGTLHHVGLTVPDLDAAVSWFEDVLDLPAAFRVPAAGSAAARPLGLAEVSYEAAVIKVGRYSLELLAFEAPRTEERKGTAGLRFAVSDLEELRRRVRAHGRAPFALPLEFHPRGEHA